MAPGAPETARLGEAPATTPGKGPPTTSSLGEPGGPRGAGHRHSRAGTARRPGRCGPRSPRGSGDTAAAPAGGDSAGAGAAAALETLHLPPAGSPRCPAGSALPCPPRRSRGERDGHAREAPSLPSPAPQHLVQAVDFLGGIDHFATAGALGVHFVAPLGRRLRRRPRLRYGGLRWTGLREADLSSPALAGTPGVLSGCGRARRSSAAAVEEAALQLTAARQHVRVGGRGAGAAAAPAARRPPPPPPPCACALGSPRRGLRDSRRAPRCSRKPSQAHRRGPQRGEGRRGGRTPRRSRPERGEMAAGGTRCASGRTCPGLAGAGPAPTRGREREMDLSVEMESERSDGAAGAAGSSPK